MKLFPKRSAAPLSIQSELLQETFARLRRDLNAWAESDAALAAPSGPSGPSAVSPLALPFYDGGQDYIFSDWLLAACFDFGQDLDELVLGGLPDLSAAIAFDGRQRTFREGWRRHYRVLKLAKILQKHLAGKVLIDLGAGDPCYSIVPAYLAQWAGAAAYWAIDPLYRPDLPFDLRAFQKLALDKESPDSAASALRRTPKIFLLSGIELRHPESTEGQAMVSELMASLENLCERGDGILLCVSSRDCEVKSPFFSKTYDDAYIEFFVRNH